MSTPADELRTAATTLRDLADAVDRDIATNPYWATEAPSPHAYPSLYARGIDRATPAAGAFAAAMHPGVGAALAELLEHHALHVDAVHKAAANIWPTAAERSERVDWIEKQISTPALAVARQINGSPS